MGHFITHTIKSSIAAFLLASSSAACADGLPSGVGNSLPPDAQAAIDAARYHDAHDGLLAARAKAKLDASARGVEPPVARQSAVPAPNPPAPPR